MPFTKHTTKPVYSPEDRKQLTALARQAIDYAMNNSNILPFRIEEYPLHLQQQKACFVTLNRHAQLRGCIGSLQAYRPLVEDIIHNAIAAAFSDHRFAPLQASELLDTEIHISVLSTPEDFPIASEQDLLNRLTPGEDGLILQERQHRATFLPSVWESLPEPWDFLQHLKQKAGLPGDYWSDNMHFQIYHTESF